MLETVQCSAFERPKPGVYLATFMGREVRDTKIGNSYLWTFKMASGKTLSGFGGNPAQTPTMNNRSGKWLCALAGKPPSECQVDPDACIGKQYQCIVGEEGKLETFTPCA